MSQTQDIIYKLEANIDDCSGEVLGYTMDTLLQAGARDVHYTPVFMKKNRPAWQLNVLCKEEDIPALERIIFRETSTIGVRRIRYERTIMHREIIDVTTPYGTIQIKKCSYEDIVKYYPEYDSVAAIARAQEVPYSEVYQAALLAASK